MRRYAILDAVSVVAVILGVTAFSLTFESLWTGFLYLGSAALSIVAGVATLRKRDPRPWDRVIGVALLVFGAAMGALGANPWLWLGFSE